MWGNVAVEKVSERADGSELFVLLVFGARDCIVSDEITENAVRRLLAQSETALSEDGRHLSDRPTGI
jgi:hypothetical protein